MRRNTAVTICVLLVCAGAWASSPEPLTLFDFEGGDKALLQGALPSSEMAKVGKHAGKWVDHVANPNLIAVDVPQDWSEWDTISLWLYSGKANGAEFMMLIYSENPDSDGADYYWHQFKLDWTGWKQFRFAFWELGRARRPVGFQKIDSVRFAADGWGNEPRADSVVYIDGVGIERLGVRATNGGFEDDADGDGVPDGWKYQPAPDNERRFIDLVEGRSGKGLRLRDDTDAVGLGAEQFMPVRVGQKYRLSCWKEGDVLGLYINWYDADGKPYGEQNITRAEPTEKGKWVPVEVVATAPEGAVEMQLWLYSFYANVGTVTIDDVKIEEID